VGVGGNSGGVLHQAAKEHQGHLEMGKKRCADLCLLGASWARAPRQQQQQQQQQQSSTGI